MGTSLRWFARQQRGYYRLIAIRGEDNRSLLELQHIALTPEGPQLLTSAAVEYRKPDEKFFNLVLERWDALPYEVVVVGDSLLHDIKGGIELGALTVQTTFETDAQVTHDNARVDGQIAADAVLAEWRELVELVRGWAK